MRFRVACIVVGILLAGASIASCGGASVARPREAVGCEPAFGLGDGPCGAICDYAAPAGVFEGRLVAVNGAEVTFQVDRVRLTNVASRDTPEPVAGRRLVVTYEHGEQQVLRAARRYRVMVWWLTTPRPAHFYSGVHTSKTQCSGGTIHADGTTIDT